MAADRHDVGPLRRDHLGDRRQVGVRREQREVHDFELRGLGTRAEALGGVVGERLVGADDRQP